jgi:hypothetical protein
VTNAPQYLPRGKVVHLKPANDVHPLKVMRSIAWYRFDRACIGFFGFNAFETLVCLSAAAFMGAALAVQI